MVVLFVILTLAVAITIELMIAKSKAKEPKVSVSSIPVFNKASMFIPGDYLLSKYHVWLKEETSGIKAGIDNFILKATDNIKISRIAKEGLSVKEGDVLFNANVNGTDMSFKSPVNGKVKKVNNNLLGKNIEEPYGKDWALEIETENFDRTGLMSLDNAKHWLRSELRRFKDFLSETAYFNETAGVTMYDGGNITEGVLSKMESKVVKEFEEKFLNG
jgi:glycine cleavage system H protein